MLFSRSVGLICALLLVLIASLSAQPCLQGWTYRVPVQIDNIASSTTLSQFQVAFNINTQELIAAGKLNYDGSDIRILSSSGSVLPFWIEKPTFNSQNTKIWVRVPLIATNSVETIYLFYGRQSAMDISSGDNTFELFDDFNDVAINSSKWDFCNGGNLVMFDDYLTISSSEFPDAKATLLSKKTFSVPVVGESYVNAVSGSGGSYIGLLDPISKDGYGLFYGAMPGTTMRMKLFSNDINCYSSENESPSPNAVSSLDTDGVWYFSWPSSGNQRIDWPGSSLHPLNRTDATYSLPANTAFTIGNMELEGSMKVDWVRVRKYAAYEPLASLGEEVASVTSASATNNGPICEGETLQLFATDIIGAQYNWTGPNGFSSSLQRPIIPNATHGMSGIYQVEVSIPTGCSSVTASTDVIVSSPTVVGQVSGEAKVCAGNNSGTLTLSGNTGQIIRWEFSNSGAEPWGTINKTSNELLYTNLVTTTYFKAVVQNGACKEESTNAIRVEVSPTTLGGKAIGSSTSCSQDNSGTILLSGHTGLVTAWQSSTDNWVTAEDIDLNSESLTFANLVTTTSFRAIVQSGICDWRYSEPATIWINALPEVNFVAEAVCDGSPTTFVNSSSVTSGVISSYLWDFGDGTSSIEKDPVKQFLNNGTYNVKLTATSDKGCTAEATQLVVVNEYPVANFTVENVCLGSEVLVRNRSTYSAGGLTYSWDFGDGRSSDRTDPTHSYDSPGVFPIKLIVTTSLGCKDSLTRYVEVYNPPKADAGKDTLVSKGYTARLLAKGGVAYSWEPITGLSNSNIANPDATPLETTSYTVTVFDARGCSSTDEITVFVEDDFRLQVSNVLTPDGNGINDTWVIKNIENFSECNVRIYDRWGREVFSQKGYKNNWAGYKGTDLLPDGTYYYLISFGDSNKEYKGAITLLRNQNK